ncbi:VanZ family protein [Streptomyces sp. TR02-1]|uniref:VanZ family protein n=1 Tax=Streptomyces sp. TR02-1 TaxID=3385977 RepID=UPI0039A24A5B
MLKAVFNGHEGFLVLCLIITVAGGGFAYRLASRRSPRPALFGLWIASILAVLLLTLWTTGGGGGPIVCTINKSVWEPFSTVQGRLNAGMFVPFGLIGVMATRRVLPVALLGIVLTAGIETFQSVLPFVGRLCDTSDLVANSAGALCGVALGALVNGLGKEQEEPAFLTTSRTLAVSGVALAVLVGTWGLWMTPNVVDRDRSEISASDSQREAITRHIHQALGSGYRVKEVSFTPGPDGSGTISASLPGGAAELTWPDRERFRVDLVPSYLGTKQSFAIPGATGPVDSADGAAARATAYAKKFAPWALQDSRRTATAQGEGEGLNWMVSWRREKDGILMPMRLDVVIEPSGRLTNLLARHIDDPALPPLNTSQADAWAAMEQHFHRTASDSRKSEPVLLAQRREGDWRVHWLLTLHTKQHVYKATIDGTTGHVYSPTVLSSTPESAGAQP